MKKSKSISWEFDESGRVITEVEPLYQPRFVTKDQLNELINLYHLADTALSGTDYHKWDKLNYAAKEFHKKYPNISETAAYKDISNQMTGY